MKVYITLHFSLEKSSHVLLKVDEANVLINAIKNANIPKFLSDDVILFERILADIFPDSAPPSNDHIALEVTCCSLDILSNSYSH